MTRCPDVSGSSVGNEIAQVTPILAAASAKSKQVCCPSWREETAKTYNSGYSLVVTHLTTNPPVRCLNRAERTGSLVFNVLWSYVLGIVVNVIYIATKISNDLSEVPCGMCPSLYHRTSMTSCRSVQALSYTPTTTSPLPLRRTSRQSPERSHPGANL
jgi:hypothetical protein